MSSVDHFGPLLDVMIDELLDRLNKMPNSIVGDGAYLTGSVATGDDRSAPLTMVAVIKA
jgi:hypothetical protein